MALQDILKKIIEEAEARIAVMKADAEKEKEKLQAESKALEIKQLKEIQERQKKAEASLEQKTRAMAARENSNKLLAIKQDIIMDALSQFCKKLEDSDDKVYESIIKPLIEKITLKKGTIFVPKSRVAITTKLLNGRFDIKADDTIGGGFLLTDGGAEIDCTFKNMVFSEFKDELTAFFAQKLNLL